MRAAGSSRTRRTRSTSPRSWAPLIDKGLLGGPVIEDKKGEVVGLLVGGGAEARMIASGRVTKALAEANVTPGRRADRRRLRAGADPLPHPLLTATPVPAFQRVLDLYPGHTVAAAHLKTSQAKRGTAEDQATKTAAASTDTPRGCAAVARSSPVAACWCCGRC
ncbi:hypothetical protein GCM10017559_71130 [Streptosporangium longisporum]|uniref:CBS domain-containing protein n=1 Tax=Streptosporangium longisporum TaxID=46187 RepID=A0ABP6L8L7_9ACTN